MKMKQLKNVFVFLLAALSFTACEEEEIVSYVLQDISAPTNVNAIFDIAQDESGEVSVTPTAVGASVFEVYFGDVDNETPTEVAPGETVTHVYAEGEFLLRVVAIGPTGLTSELNRVITIAFTQPTNLEVDIEISQANPFEVLFTPTADDATVFDVFWGDVENETPETKMAGEEFRHLYAEVGDYTIRVVARSASATTIEYSETVSITGASDPIVLPITFDIPTVNYAFGTFNGASYEVVDNPDLSGANTEESKVGAITNSGNAFEGGAFTLGTPVDFSGDNKTITMKFWSNVALPILLKFEGGVNGERENEVVVDHGGTGWEELSFDFGVNAVKSFIDGSQGVGEPFVPTGQYGTIVLFVDGPGTTAGTFYMDDIDQSTGGGGGTDLLELPLTFDVAGVDYAATTFNGAEYEVVANPDQSGANTSASNVAAVTNSGVNWEGLFWELDTPVDFSGDNKTITMKLWSTVSLPILLKFEGGVNGERQNEVVVTHGGSGWEDLSFDFAVNAVKSFIDGSQGVGEPFVPTGQYATITLFIDGPGTTPGTFYLDDIAQDGTGGGGGPMAPSVGPDAPSFDAADVISIYSDSYTDNPRDGFNFYGSAAFEEVDLGGNMALKYTFVEGGGGNFQVIELGANQIDAVGAGMTNFRFDAWFPNEVLAETAALFKLVDINGATVTEALINVNASSDPAIAQGQWLTFDFTIAELQGLGLGAGNNIQQFVIDLINSGEVYLDNLLFYVDNGGGGGGPIAPTMGPDAPTQDAADVISIYSDSYTDNPRDGFNFYGSAAFEEVDLGGNMALKYTFVDGGGGNFQVIELGGANQIDAAGAGMTNFRFDAWFPNEVAADTQALFKLVDIGGSVTEAIITVNSSSNPAIAQGQWLNFDFTIAELQGLGLGGSSNIQQFVVDLINSGEVYLDNLYFYNDGSGGGGPIAPTMGPDAPTQDAADVISIYSDSYTDNPRDGFNLYGSAAFEEVDLGGNMALKYTFVDGGGGNFQVIELGGANQIDAAGAGMTNFRFDAWFPNEVAADTQALFKLVDIGGSVTEALITVNSSSNPAIAQGQWLNFDFTITELEGLGLGGSANIQQFVIDLINSGEVYLDNLYFYNNSAGAPIAPTMGPAAPTQDAADVISIYSDSYTDVPRDGFNFYGSAAFEEVDLGGNMALKYTFVDGGGGNFQVIELGGANQIDAAAAGMTNLRFDLWFPNEVAADTQALFKFVDIGGSVTEAVMVVNDSSSPAIAQGQWLSFDYTFTELQGLGLGGSANIQQFVVDLINSGEVYIDNIYMYK